MRRVVGRVPTTMIIAALLSASCSSALRIRLVFPSQATVDAAGSVQLVSMTPPVIVDRKKRST